MAISSIAAFWAVAALLIAVPGADWAYVIGTVVGGRPVLLAVGGLVTGYAAVTIVVAAGVGALVARTPVSLTVLTIAGGLYLIWLGLRTFTRSAAHGNASSPAAAAAPTPVAAATSRATLVRGIGVSGLNPKGLLVFLALLPQFTTPRGSWPLTVQLAVLGLVFILTCALFYLGMGSLIRRLLDAKPAVARVISRVSGAAMILIGLLLLAERLVA
ncbi:MAG TPA: LysE family translocator [Streptosporangiaceae bacterium]|jgi:threonine/homoserine/homoserine lactone efflux protein|nr:LysE family translocator [Streptosporangiaceae bacterium]